MKLRTINAATNLKDDSNMERTNYCPVLNNAETDSPLISENNPRKYNSRYCVLALDDFFATIMLYITKKNQGVANVTVTYDTRDGYIQKDIKVQLEGDDFIDISKWTREVHYIGKYIKALVHKFAELNDQELINAYNRPKRIVVADEKHEKRPYNYHVDSFEVKGCYVNGKNGNRFYRRPYTRVISKN